MKMYKTDFTSRQICIDEYLYMSREREEDFLDELHDSFEPISELENGRQSKTPWLDAPNEDCQ